MLISLVVFLILSLINLCYYLGFFRFAFDKSSERKPEREIPVSVIVCAKNEAENLRSFLPSILSQNHPNFEVVVINDASTDDSLEVIESFQKTDSRVKIVNVQNNEAFWANKKYALTLGIKKAMHPHLLFTDADCEPETELWISEMAAKFSEEKSIVLGYGGYLKRKYNLLNKLIRFETFLTAIQYFSYAKWGTPYMGVGRNLAYTSKEFYNQKGFASHLHLRSGDDDLFVNEAATATNTAVCYSRNSITRSVPKKSLKDWWQQKRRHVSVAGHYKTKHQVLLGIFYISQLFFWIMFFSLLFTKYWAIVVGVFIFRLIVQSILFYQAGQKLHEKDLIWIFPFLEVFLVCFQFGIFISNTISKPNHWK